MSINIVSKEYRGAFDKIVGHPLQSWSWGEFRQKLGQKVIRLGQFSRGKWSPAEDFAGRTSRTDGARRRPVRGLAEAAQFSAHKIPGVPWTIGYCPRGGMPTREMLEAIKKEGQRHNCIFIKFEPGVLKGPTPPRRGRTLIDSGLKPGKALFTPFTFQVDLTKSEEELLAGMKPKTRYNIRLAEKKGVTVEEDNSDEAFEEFQNLTEQTILRQHFYVHDRRYRQLMWQTMKDAGIAHLLVARLPSTRQRVNASTILSAWIIFIFNGVGYYPYGASSDKHRELMASNLLAWRALQLAKKSGCKKFDFWGSLGPEPDTKDSWYGFHRFKEGYGGELVEFVGTYDLVINSPLYSVYKIADRIRWRILRLKF